MCQVELKKMAPIELKTNQVARTDSPGGHVSVVNPMHIITLKAHKHSFGVRLAARIRSFSEQWFSHVLLLLVLCAYSLFGAIVFYAIEAEHTPGEKINVKTIRINIAGQLWDMMANVTSKDDWVEGVGNKLQEYEEALQSICEDDVEWTIWSSLFYCGTVLTTIGYGNISPSTNAGRAVTIVYAFLGIPLMLMVLADLGKLFTKAIKFVFRYFRRFYKTGTFNKTKAAAKLYGDKPLQYMTVSWRTVSQDQPPGQVSNKRESGQDTSLNQVTSLTLHNDELYKDLDSANDEANHKHVEVEDEFNLPVSLAVVMVLIYMVVGAFLFAVWEEWSFFESFYFVFISMSTVGFGDYFPKRQDYMMAAFAYLVLGLTITSMCINVIQEKLSAIFQKAKVRIGNTIGLDVNTLLREDQQRTKHQRSNSCELRKSFRVGSKQHTLQKENMSGSLSRPETPLSGPDIAGGGISPKGVDNFALGGLGREVLLNLPVQNRFKFYDSPYSTIHNSDTIHNPSIGQVT